MPDGQWNAERPFNPKVRDDRQTNRVQPIREVDQKLIRFRFKRWPLRAVLGLNRRRRRGRYFLIGGVGSIVCRSRLQVRRPGVDRLSRLGGRLVVCGRAARLSGSIAILGGNTAGYFGATHEVQ